MYTVSNIPHLQNVRLAVEYREFPEREGHRPWAAPKWKHDPDIGRYHGLSPRNKYYVNGEMVGEELPTLSQTSKTPFPEKRVPRRGLLQVYPEDPDYTRLCVEQGLEHLLQDRQPPSLINGVDSPTVVHKPFPPVGSGINGTNGHATDAETISHKELPNGTNGA
jgi:hypothetical protein